MFKQSTTAINIFPRHVFFFFLSSSLRWQARDAVPTIYLPLKEKEGREEKKTKAEREERKKKNDNNNNKKTKKKDLSFIVGKLHFPD